MSLTVNLNDIIEALELAADEMPSFLDLTTGEVETIHSELLSMAEDDENDQEPSLPQWQRDEWEIAKRMVRSPEDFRELPTKHDIHEWEIMRGFSESVEDPKLRQDLQRAIHGSGAFRMFKDTVRRYQVEKNWYAFRADSLREIAIDWCEENDVRWRERIGRDWWTVGSRRPF